ncbi:MAG: FAD-dependent monooxygenase, partial [Phycisphaerae bacterium]
PLRAIGGVMNYGELRTAAGRVLSRQRVAVWDRELGEFCVGVHRAELLALLLGPLDPSRVHFDRRCVDVIDDGERVRARFANGHADEADLLVAADGLNSVVRAALHGDHPPRYSGYTCWRGIAQSHNSLIPPGHLCEIWGRGRRFGFLSLGGARVYWFATLNAPPNGRDLDGRAARTSLLSLFGDWFGPPRALLEATPDDAIIRNDILDRPPARNWGRGRITLLGDAAHPTTPNIGQGACMAIEDALVLARALRPFAHTLLRHRRSRRRSGSMSDRARPARPR